MAIAVRSADEGDRVAVETIATEALEALRQSPSVAQWGTRMRRGFVEGWLPGGVTCDGLRFVIAEAGGVVVGAGSVQHGGRHPHGFLRIQVRPNSRNRGVGTAIFSALTADDAQPLVVREMLSDPATIDFYANRGFVTGERTLEGLIDPSAHEVAAWCDSVRSESSEFEVESAGGRFTEEEIAWAADRLYLWTHPWSPPRPLGQRDAVRFHLGQARPEDVVGAWIGDDLVGVSLLTDSPFDPARPVAHVALCGVVDAAAGDAADVTRSLLAATLQKCSSEGVVVEVEANDGNRFLWDALQDIPGADLFSDMMLLVSGSGVAESSPLS